MRKDKKQESSVFSFSSSEIREEVLLNLFGVRNFDDIPTKKLLEFCNKHYCTKEV